METKKVLSGMSNLDLETRSTTRVMLLLAAAVEYNVLRPLLHQPEGGREGG